VVLLKEDFWLIVTDSRSEDEQKIRKCRSEGMTHSPQWQWHLDEVFVKIRGQTHCLWRAVDHEGEVLESFVTKTRDKASALKFMRKAMKRYGNPHVVVTDKCPSYRAAMKVIGSERRQETGRHLNNRAENSHLPFRRQERAVSRSGACEVFRDSPQSIRLCAITSIIKGISRAGPGSNRYATSLFSNGAS
jgi:transposase-like protein